MTIMCIHNLLLVLSIFIRVKKAKNKVAQNSYATNFLYDITAQTTIQGK